MTIVSDTSPISYLVLIGEEKLLPTLYGEVLIPEAVHRELGHPQGPEPVRDWIETSPSWLSVESVRAGGKCEEKPLQSLDPGEREAIVLVRKEVAGILLIDEQAGRQVARNFGLEVTGTIGVLGAAVKKGHVDATQVAKSLRETTFRASPDLYRWLISQQEQD